MAAQRQVTQAVSQLREPSRTAVILRWYHGLSYADLADQLGISEANAAGRAKRGHFTTATQKLFSNGASMPMINDPNVFTFEQLAGIWNKAIRKLGWK